MVLTNRKVIGMALIAFILANLTDGAVVLLLAGLVFFVVLRATKKKPKKAEPRKQYTLPIGPEELPEQKEARFRAEYEDLINRFFEEHPSVIRWWGDSLSCITVLVKRSQMNVELTGHFEVSDDGELTSFEQHYGPWGVDHFTLFKRKAPADIPQEMLVNQLAGLLKDDEAVAKYCDQVAATLLDEGHCVFNVPVGLRISESEYKDRYYNEDWENAWKTALSGEFQVKSVDVSEDKTGCYRLTAA